ncbi:MAG: LCP family protein [Oscillospiraceae bacterium]
MSTSKKGSFVFFITLLISFMVLGSVFLVILILSKAKNANVKQEAIPYISEYHPSREESLAILFLGCDNAESSPDVAVLLYYDAPQGILYPIVLPTVTVSNVNGKTDTLQGHYDYEGMRGGVNAIKAIFGIELDRYARLQKVGASNIVDFFGGIPYNLPYDRIIGTQTILKGEQLLDGRRVSSLLFSKNKNGSCDYKLQSELISKLIEDGFDKNLIEKYTNFVSVIFYNCETNLNQYDFAKRQTGFLNRLKLDSMVTTEILVEGEYNSDFTSFHPSKQSIDKIKSIFE